jgi:hypothetical protein
MAAEPSRSRRWNNQPNPAKPISIMVQAGGRGVAAASARRFQSPQVWSSARVASATMRGMGLAPCTLFDAKIIVMTLYSKKSYLNAY